MSFGNDETMQKRWKDFCRKTDIEVDDFGTVLKTISTFLRRPFVATVEGNSCDSLSWVAIENEWQ